MLILLALSVSLSFRLQPEECKKLLSLKKTPLKDNRASSRERSPSATPQFIIMEDSTDGNEDNQTDREASPSTMSDSELPAGPKSVDDVAIRG